MPTADVYERAALLFDESAEQVHRLVRPAIDELTPAVMTGGTISTEVMSALVANSATATSIECDAQALATTCRRHAEACRQLTRARREWNVRNAQFEAAMSWWWREAQAHWANPESTPWPGSAPVGPGLKPTGPSHITPDE